MRGLIYPNIVEPAVKGEGPAQKNGEAGVHRVGVAKVYIALGRYSSAAQAGLPQGSPISPMPFLFFNVNLVQTTTNKNQRAIAFVDDYTAWVTGESTIENTIKLQQDIIPKAELRESQRGATFQPEKTAFVPSTRGRNHEDDIPLLIKGNHVQPAESIKLLGVVFDRELRFKLHMARSVKRSIRAAFVLKRLKSLRASTWRQVFQSTVAPVMDYALVVWALKGTKSTLKCLQSPQRIAAQATTIAFSSASLEMAEAEADIQ